MIRKNIWKVALCLIFTLLIISSCSEAQSTEVIQIIATTVLTQVPTNTVSPTEEILSGTVIIWHSWEEMQRSVLFRRITAFQALYPDIQFDVSYIPAIDLRASFESAMAESFGPTILIGSAEWGAELYENGWVEDIKPYIQNGLLDILNQGAVNTGRYQDKIISMPLHQKGVVLYRNKNIIPNPAINFDSFVSLARNADQGGVVGAMLERSFYFSGGHLFGLGGTLMNSEGLPAFNQDEYRLSLSWLEMLKSFEQAGTSQFQSDNDLRYFLDERVGFIIESTSRMYDLAGEIDPLNLAIDPWPTYKDGKMAGFIQTESAYITPRALEEEGLISLLFLESLFSPEAQASLSGVGYIPCIDPRILDDTNQRIADPFVAQAMTAMTTGPAYPPLPVMSLYITQMDAMLQAVLLQGADPLAALQSAYNVINEQIQLQNP